MYSIIEMGCYKQTESRDRLLANQLSEASAVFPGSVGSWVLNSPLEQCRLLRGEGRDTISETELVKLEFSRQQTENMGLLL